MFYISPWMFLGLILGTAYFVLVLLGYGGNRDAKKTRKKSEEKLVSSTKTTTDFARQKQLQITDEKPGTVEWQKESQRHKLEAKKQIGEVTFSSRQTSDATKSFVGLKLAPAGSEKEEKLIAEQSIESVGVEDVLQSQDALYLREFSVPEDLIIERQRIRTSSHESENIAEISTESIEKVNGSGLLEGKDAEVSENITPTLCSSVSSVPYEQRFDDIAVPDNEQPTLLSDVMGTNSSTDLKQAILFGDLADLLVTRAKTGAFHHIDLESNANYLAEKMSTQIVCDALGQFATSSVSGDQDLESPDHIQELHSFAENVVDSLIEDAFGKVSVVEDAESFAKDLSEQVVHEGMEHYAVMEKLKQGKKQKVSLQEMKLFSEGIISEVVSDGIDEAVVQDINTSECINSEDKNLPEERSPENEDNFAQQTALSSSLQPHITGVVENLVNGAIYEAALRVKARGTEPRSEDSSLDVRAREILESQVVETVKEVIGSALHKAADFEEEKGELEDESSQTNKSKLESRLDSFVDDALDAAVSEAAGKVLDEKSVSDKKQKLLNGHVDLSLESPPEEVVSSDRTNQSQGVVEVPLKEKEEKVELRDKGTGESSDYWRQSLILDLQGDEEEFDESFESERSQPSTADSPITPVHKETVSDEDDSEEFIDSSEDEVIDHAEDAKLGAVGGSNVKTYESDDDDDDKMAFGDELDDGIDIDDDDDEDEEDDLLFAGQSMVDGLCVSKPKEKRKKKKKSLPRPRIQSEPESYVLSTNENILGGYVLSTNENFGGYVPSANENVGDYVFSANENIDSMYAGSHYNTAVVIDNGSGVIKLGLAGEKTPTVVQPALYGIPKRYSLQMAGLDNKKDRMYGDSATMRAGVMQLDYPMSSGFLENWSDVEDIWEYMLYEELGIEEGNHPVLVTEVANTPKKNREKMAEILFEHLGVPAMYLANQLVLSLYASGLTVGVCLSSGFSVTQAAAIYEGHILAYTVQELDIGGKSLTDNLQKLLRENKGHNFNSSSGWQIVNNMKERKAYVAKDYSSELIHFKTSDALTQYYSLPDGQAVEISSEMISTPEPLFNPETLLGADDTIASQEPIHKLVNNAFRRCSPELQDNIYRNIVLSGGTTLMKGLVPRLEYELGKINPRLRSVRAPDNRMYSAWIGGSILGSLSTLDSMYATIDEYADYGGRIVNQKCF